MVPSVVGRIWEGQKTQALIPAVLQTSCVSVSSLSELWFLDPLYRCQLPCSHWSLGLTLHTVTPCCRTGRNEHSVRGISKLKVIH